MVKTLRRHQLESSNAGVVRAVLESDCQGDSFGASAAQRGTCWGAPALVGGGRPDHRRWPGGPCTGRQRPGPFPTIDGHHQHTMTDARGAVFFQEIPGTEWGFWAGLAVGVLFNRDSI